MHQPKEIMFNHKKKKGISVKISQMALSSPPPLSDSSLFANSPKPPIEPLLQPISTENDQIPIGDYVIWPKKNMPFISRGYYD